MSDRFSDFWHLAQPGLREALKRSREEARKAGDPPKLGIDPSAGRLRGGLEGVPDPDGGDAHPTR
jgi:hypothetical protein